MFVKVDQIKSICRPRWIILAALFAIVFNQAGALASDTSSGISVAPVLETRIEPGANVVYCSTLQMAWNELCNTVIKSELKLEGAPAYAKNLNDAIGKPLILAEGSYIAMVGRKKEDIINKIRRALDEKFSDLPKGHRPKPPVESDLYYPDDIMAFAFLCRLLSFANKFEDVKFIPFAVDGKTMNVKAFGISTETRQRGGEEYAKLLEQVAVDYTFFSDRLDSAINRLDSKQFSEGEIARYRNAPEKLFRSGKMPPKGFILTLAAGTGEDELVISTLPPAGTLLETYEQIDGFRALDSFETLLTEGAAARAIAREVRGAIIDVDKNKHFGSLRIPEISFDVDHRFEELEKKNVLNDGFEGHQIKKVQQIIRFSLDATGAQLSSQATIVMKGAMKSDRVTYMVDGPFIVYLKNRSDARPYFMAYIRDAGFMKKYDSPDNFIMMGD